MPNFDGSGPLKRGRVIGRGLGPCKRSDNGCNRRTVTQTDPEDKEIKAD
jgi:hypothetical protein